VGYTLTEIAMQLENKMGVVIDHPEKGTPHHDLKPSSDLCSK
jgi:hypothetical protein